MSSTGRNGSIASQWGFSAQRVLDAAIGEFQRKLEWVHVGTGTGCTLFLGDFISSDGVDLQHSAGIVCNTSSGTIVRVYPGDAPRSDHRDASITRTAIHDFQGVSAIAVHALPAGTVCVAGFYDAHARTSSAALPTNPLCLDLSICSDWSSAAGNMRIQARECTRNHSDGTRWLIGTGFRSDWFGSAVLESEQLDCDVARELCVCVKDYTCGSLWLNSIAMDVFMIKHKDLISLWKTKGWICGGVLKEDAAVAVCRLLFQLSLDDYVFSIKRSHRTLLAHGVVGYQEACLEMPGLDSVSKVDAYLQVFEGCMAYHQPRVRGLLRMRPQDDVAEILDCMKRLQQRQFARFIVDGVGVFLDGFVEQATPGAESGLPLRSECCGRLQESVHQKWQHQHLVSAIDTLCSSGCSRTLHFYAEGDAAVMQAVKCCDQILCSASFSYEFGSRCDMQIAHIRFARKEDLKIMKSAGIRAVFFPEFISSEDDDQRKMFLTSGGSTRLQNQCPWKEIACSPHLLCFGSDCSASKFDPLTSLRIALKAGMTPALALSSFTSSAAAACGMRGGLFLETYLCDFVVLQLPLKPPPPAGPPPPGVAFRNPSERLLRLNLDALVVDLVSKETRVLGVFMDGKCVFQT